MRQCSRLRMITFLASKTYKGFYLYSHYKQAEAYFSHLKFLTNERTRPSSWLKTSITFYRDFVSQLVFSFIAKSRKQPQVWIQLNSICSVEAWYNIGTKSDIIHKVKSSKQKKLIATNLSSSKQMIRNVFIKCENVFLIISEKINILHIKKVEYTLSLTMRIYQRNPSQFKMAFHVCTN